MRVHIDDEKRIVEIARDIEPRSIGRAGEQGRINATAGRVGRWPERDAVTQRGRIAPGVDVHAVAIATRGVQRVTVRCEDGAHEGRWLRERLEHPARLRVDHLDALLAIPAQDRDDVARVGGERHRHRHRAERDRRPHRIEPGAGRQPVRLGCVVAASAEHEHGGEGERGDAYEHDRAPIKACGHRLSLYLLPGTRRVSFQDRRRSHPCTERAGTASGLRRACLGWDRARRPVPSWSLGRPYQACAKSAEGRGAYPTTVRASSVSRRAFESSCDSGVGRRRATRLEQEGVQRGGLRSSLENAPLAGAEPGSAGMITAIECPPAIALLRG